MAAQITPLPTPPSRTVPATFSSLADAFLAALATFVTQANTLASEAETDAATAETKAAAASVSEVNAGASEATATAAANYKGPWSSCAGAANVPYCVSHLGAYWQLASNLADVSAKTPGTDAEWIAVPVCVVWSAISTGTTAVAFHGYICDTTSAGFTLTLPASPVAGDVIEVLDGAGTFHTNNLTIARNGKKIMGLSENMTVSNRYIGVKLVYYDTTNGWRVM
jgi:hypothetical protein